MPTPPPSRTSAEIRSLLHERLDALLDESDLVAKNAAHGQALDDLEEFYLDKGRKFLQETFQEKLQELADQTDEEGK
ncbi:MAG: hypothetical protein LBI05_03405, partial [Planctomycetaceae bacterium]|nr:hypothetical protein [Planctomycetaceae bacterium]